jgi:hypothetical protein
MSKTKPTAAEMKANLEQKGVGSTSTNRKDYAPKGWTPGATWDGNTKTGTITTGPVDKAPEDWSDMLLHWGMDPEIYEIDGNTIQFSAYDGWGREEQDSQALSKVQYAFKANLRLRSGALDENDVDLLELLELAQKRRKSKKKAVEGDTTFVVCLSDWQIGNNDGGGVDTQMDALVALPDLVKKQLADLRKVGRKIDTIAIVGLGDLFENCDGFYAHQKFTVEANMRDQAKIIRRSLFNIISELAPLAPKIIVTAVGGNHGENRGNGNRYFTDKADNGDVAVFEQVYDIFSGNQSGAYDHIDWRIPEADLAVDVDLSGYPVAFTHGHVPRPSGGAMNTLWKWWEKQALGRFYPGVASSNLLITGHFHHLNVKEQLDRTIIIAPSLTDVSDYFGDSQGVMSSPGTLTLTVDKDGWDNLRILK